MTDEEISTIPAHTNQYVAKALRNGPIAADNSATHDERHAARLRTR